MMKVVCPQVRIPEKVWKRLMAYIEVCPMEVGGLGAVEWREGDLVVTDIFLLEQAVTAASTKLDPAAVARFVADWVRRGRDSEHLRFWWHSHADMGVFWSATDLQTIRELSEENFLVSLVGNRRGETLTRLTVSKPVPFAVDGLSVVIVPETDEALLEAVRLETAAKVRPAPRHFWSRQPRIPEPAAEDANPALLGTGDEPGWK